MYSLWCSQTLEMKISILLDPLVTNPLSGEVRNRNLSTNLWAASNDEHYLASGLIKRINLSEYIDNFTKNVVLHLSASTFVGKTLFQIFLKNHLDLYGYITLARTGLE